MSPLLDIQRRGQQIGRIRLGVQVVKNGKNRPEKLEFFRFTTNSRLAADQVAALYGGEVREWKGGTERYEIITTTSELDIMIPPGDQFIRQDYELWSGAGCLRRCDGVTARLFGEGGETESACVCPADGKERSAAAAKGDACKPTTRLNVMLPDVADLGVWRCDSHGFNAAVELGGKAEVLQAARDAGRILPARLRLDAEERKTPGQPTRKFFVPRLEIGVTLRELVTGATPTMSASLPPAPPALAIEAGSSPKTAGVGTPPADPVAANTPHPGDRGDGTPTPAASSPAAGPSPAQLVADQAAASTNADAVVALGQEAFAYALLDETVTAGNDIGPLGKYLTFRVAQLRGSSADEVVDAEVVEDEPTVEDARAAASAWAESV